jgi:hypothetical protein
MAINKNFVIKNGIEVNNNLLIADAIQDRVGIATSSPQYTLDVRGGIGASSVAIKNQLTVDGPISVGSTIGEFGQYLVSTGIGASWSSLPGLRYTQTYTASANQANFIFSYNPSAGVDVYVNGVRLSSSEYTATSGTNIILNDGCYAGDTVDLIAYSVVGLGAGITGITGLTVLDEGVSVGNDGNIVSINFVGAAITSSVSGFGVTITLSEDTAIWTLNEFDEVHLREADKVGIGTDLPDEALHVDGSIKFTGDLYQGNELFKASNWTVGSGTTIYRNSFVGIGSTLPQKTLDVDGDINFSGDLFQGGSAFVASRWTAGTGDDIYKISGNIGIGTDNPTETLDVNGDVRIRGDLYSAENNVGTAGSILYTAGSGNGTYWGEPIGAQGLMGIQGEGGSQGAQGVQGLSNQGVQGSIGIQGDGGTQGAQGVQGVQGVQGLSNQGVQGSIGIQGDGGTQGAQGIQGLSNQGVQGSIGIQGDGGTQGAQGIQGLSNQGVQGSGGSQGTLGAQGAQGIQGLSNQGVQGSGGSQGTLGAQGAQGIQGTFGSQGSSGSQGTQGLQGTQGTFGPATIPQNSQTSAYQIASTDNGKHISITTGGVSVIAGIGFTAGDNVVIFNDSGSNQTVTSGAGITMYLAGTASTGNRTLFQRGLATILCVSSNRYVISGAGLT